MQLINWYPGHIAKAQRNLKENIKLVDLVIEMVDARLPVSSHFNLIEEFLNNKDRIIVLNKSDLANQEKLEQSLEYWKNKNIEALSISATNSKDILKLKGILRKYHDKLKQKLSRKGVLPRDLRVMVVGLPNIGKSTLINRLVEKRKVKSANKPGVTRTVQWVRIGENLELLDTPGIILPKFESQELAVKLAMLGSISTEAYEPLETSREMIGILQKTSPDFFETHGNDFTIEIFAQKRNFLLSGAELDIERSAKTFIKELRDGKLGQFSFE
ncbi:MAG: ribosome biogenesis GTPase YlqF [Candidatus Sericytochromatia bacterium]